MEETGYKVYLSGGFESSEISRELIEDILIKYESNKNIFVTYDENRISINWNIDGNYEKVIKNIQNVIDTIVPIEPHVKFIGVINYCDEMGKTGVGSIINNVLSFKLNFDEDVFIANKNSKSKKSKYEDIKITILTLQHEILNLKEASRDMIKLLELNNPKEDNIKLMYTVKDTIERGLEIQNKKNEECEKNRKMVIKKHLKQYFMVSILLILIFVVVIITVICLTVFKKN